MSKRVLIDTNGKFYGICGPWQSGLEPMDLRDSFGAPLYVGDIVGVWCAEERNWNGPFVSDPTYVVAEEGRIYIMGLANAVRQTEYYKDGEIATKDDYDDTVDFYVYPDTQDVHWLVRKIKDHKDTADGERWECNILAKIVDAVYKLRFYKKYGIDKGNLDHEEYFSDFSDMNSRYLNTFDEKNYAFNPTAWRLRKDEWERILDKNVIERKKMVATNIIWDVDPDETDVLEQLPKEIELPDNMADPDEISDYITELTGFCHRGFSLKEKE